VNDVLSGAYRSTFRGSGIEFEEVRPYQAGDDVRSIDWNRTAKTGEPFVKTYVEERELTLVFLVDTSRSMDFGSGRWTKRETAAQFCALISFVAMRHQDRVGLVLFGDVPGLHVPARKGGQHVLRVVREVIAAKPTSGGTDFQAVLEHQARTLRRRSLLFLVSDFLGARGGAPNGGGRDWTDTLASLARRHDAIAVRVFDPFEEDLPEAGWLKLAELESGREVELDTRSARVREAWSQEAKQRRAELARTLLRSRVDLIELATDRSLADPVVRFFRERRRRQGGAA